MSETDDLVTILSRAIDCYRDEACGCDEHSTDIIRLRDLAKSLAASVTPPTEDKHIYRGVGPFAG